VHGAECQSREITLQRPQCIKATEIKSNAIPGYAGRTPEGETSTDFLCFIEGAGPNGKGFSTNGIEDGIE